MSVVDSDVEMVEPPNDRPPSLSPAPSSHVSRVASSPSRSVLDDLDIYGSPSKSVIGDADEDSVSNDADNGEDIPTTTNDDETAEQEEEHEGSPAPEEPESDPSDTENSSDASEDDVDKDLVRAASIVQPDNVKTEAEQEPAVNNNTIQIPMLVDLPPAPTVDAVPLPTSPLSAPPTSPAKPIHKKPKSHHVPPVPPPPVAPPPMQTIRLEIQLGGPDNYEIDVRKKAHSEGIEWDALMVEKKYADDSSEGESEQEDKKDVDGDVNMEDKAKPKKKKKKKSKAATEYYDVNDPFIDDSELAIDERTYIAQTKQTGFYVSSGEVALVRDKAPKKAPATTAKGKKKPAAALSLNFPVASSSKPVSGVKKASAKSAPSSSAAPLLKGLGTKESPIPLEDEDDRAPNGANPAKGKWKASASANGEEDETEVGKKRKRAANGTTDGPKKRKPVDIENFHPELQASIAKLKVAIAAESWETKSKFPPNLKPMLNDLALQAIQLDEYNEQFFNLMPTIFPYNRFTMTKLIKRTVFKDHSDLLHAKQEELLADLARLATEGFSKAQEEWEKNVASYEEKQKEKAAQVKADSENPEGGSPHTTEDQDAAKEDNPGTGKPGTAQGPPPKRYRMTDEMKSIVWQLVQLSNELCRIENEKNGLEGSVLQVSEQGLRKTLYQRIVSSFPSGWMASGQISRDGQRSSPLDLASHPLPYLVSAMKKKMEKEVEE
ncbi:hypothetical protein MIND_01216000 [Mycena indigotica]|uniref:Ubinuclein middle domain-containing protein n=1 Tax=Mycena indigotica TaxID=2126181 RepID=A0A8H6S3T6_9AGAR|nr:uncharacterized protein MIND_01216000 [Mycena indigotica]KAF7291907.1 hypothetical protein MIND_01216000 [Mycena indigotica]